MIRINAMGDVCPIPVIKTKTAIKDLNGKGKLEILVDNEIAVQNLNKMANQKGYSIINEKLEENKYLVTMILDETKEGTAESSTTVTASDDNKKTEMIQDYESISTKRKVKIAVISSDTMGSGAEELGKVLMKGFIYALSQQEEVPDTILFYNGGAKLSCEGSDSLSDLKVLEEAGTEIMTCGTCLNYYGIAEKLEVGTVTNMYSIVEAMMGADLVIKP